MLLLRMYTKVSLYLDWIAESTGLPRSSFEYVPVDGGLGVWADSADAGGVAPDSNEPASGDESASSDDDSDDSYSADWKGFDSYDSYDFDDVYSGSSDSSDFSDSA